jgi:hypothetical protein
MVQPVQEYPETKAVRVTIGAPSGGPFIVR